MVNSKRVRMLVCICLLSMYGDVCSVWKLQDLVDGLSSRSWGSVRTRVEALKTIDPVLIVSIEKKEEDRCDVYDLLLDSGDQVYAYYYKAEDKWDIRRVVTAQECGDAAMSLDVSVILNSSYGNVIKQWYEERNAQKQDEEEKADWEISV